MTTPRTRSRSKQRICVRCGSGIAESRPVFLVATDEGRIVGPYHAGCAARIASEQKVTRRPIEVPGRTYGHIIAAQMPLPEGDQEGEA